MKKRGVLGAAMLAALCCIGSHAAESKGTPGAESFFTNPAVLDAQLSPEGSLVAMVMVGAVGRQVLAVAPTDHLEQVQVIAGSNSLDVVKTSWINEKRLFFSIADLKHEGFKANASGLAVNADGSRLTQLLAGNWEFNQENTGTSIKKRILPADYHFYATPNDGSDDIIVTKYIYNNVDNLAESKSLYRLNTLSRNLTPLLDGPQPPKTMQWVLDGLQRPRIAVTFDKGRRRVMLRNLEGGDWTELGNFDYTRAEGWTPAFFDFNGHLYVTVGLDDGTSALYEYDLQKRALASEPTIRVAGFDFDGYQEVDYKAQQLLGIHYRSDAIGTVWLNKRMAALQKQLDAVLPNTINTISCGNCLSSSVLLVKSESDKQPTQYFVYRKAEQQLVEVAAAYPDIKPEQMGARDFIRYAARDGMSIPAYITVPPGSGKGPWPTVVLVHGGPYVRGGSWEWDPEAQFLATRGYLVIQPEFRGSTGFGYKHYRGGWKQWGMAMQDDLADAAKWAISKGLADPKRIAIAGSNYGGYAALMGLIKDPELFRAGVEWAGISDLNLMFSVNRSAASDTSLEWLDYSAKVQIGDPETDAALFKKNSPLERASEIRQPVLLAHGGLDRRVPIIHGSKLRNAVSQNNTQVEWVVYPEENHAWRFEKSRIDFWKRVEVFLEKNLKPAG